MSYGSIMLSGAHAPDLILRRALHMAKCLDDKGLLDGKVLIGILKSICTEISSQNLPFLLMANEKWVQNLVYKRGSWPNRDTWQINAKGNFEEYNYNSYALKSRGISTFEKCFPKSAAEVPTLEAYLISIFDTLFEKYCDSDSDAIHSRLSPLLSEFSVSQEIQDALAPIRSSHLISEFLVSTASHKGTLIEKKRRPSPTKHRTSPPAKADGDPLQAYFPADSVFSLSKDAIDPELLPNVTVSAGTVFSYDPNKGSPLFQIMNRHREKRYFLLYGDGGSGTSGTGKTTSLRQLYYEHTADDPIFVPLCEVYGAVAMRRFHGQDGWPRLTSWLNLHGHSYTSPSDMNGSLLLLDGLDEVIDRDGIAALCDDLRFVATHTNFRIAVSSKLPLEQLPAGDQLMCVSSLWDRFLRCRISPMSTEQKRALLGMDNPLLPMLNTPFLLSLYGAAQPPESDHLQLERWLPQITFNIKPIHPAQLFYRALAIQICRWYDTNGDDTQAESDAFLLMFALPAVAFRMEVSKIYDEQYLPGASALNSESINNLLDLAFSVYKGSLHHYPSYKNTRAPYTLATAPRKPGQESLLLGQAGAVLCRDWDPTTLEFSYRFVNHATQEFLAALHLANLLFCAEKNSLPTEDKLTRFYLCPIRFLPQNLLKNAAVLLDQLHREAGWTEFFLADDPTGLEQHQPLARYLLCSMAVGLCTALQRENTAFRWRQASEEAYRTLIGQMPETARQYEMDHCMNLCNLAGQLRDAGKLTAAAEKARSAIRFCSQQRLDPADGYHTLATVYLSQIKQILNQTDPNAPLLTPSQAEIELADRVYEELSNISVLKKQGLSIPEESPVFGRLLPENTALTDAYLQILEKSRFRMEQYRSAPKFSTSAIQLLLRISYVAKAHSVYAAYCPTSSGAAMNLLACFFENNQELLENHPELPFFRTYPELHLPLEPDTLSYTQQDVNAARIYFRIYYIRRGLQPYSARQLALALLRGRIRLDAAGNPVSPTGTEGPFTAAELSFLDESTRRACTRLQPTYSIPRLRLLNERIRALRNSENNEAILQLEEEAGMYFRREWECGQCTLKLSSDPTKEADLLTAMLVPEYSPRYSSCSTEWPALIDFFLRNLGITPYAPPKVSYTTVPLLQKHTVAECFRRLIQTDVYPHLRRADPRWREVEQHLAKK